MSSSPTIRAASPSRSIRGRSRTAMVMASTIDSIPAPISMAMASGTRDSRRTFARSTTVREWRTRHRRMRMVTAAAIFATTARTPGTPFRKMPIGMDSETHATRAPTRTTTDSVRRSPGPLPAAGSTTVPTLSTRSRPMRTATESAMRATTVPGSRTRPRRTPTWTESGTLAIRARTPTATVSEIQDSRPAPAALTIVRSSPIRRKLIMIVTESATFVTRAPTRMAMASVTPGASRRRAWRTTARQYRIRRNRTRTVTRTGMPVKYAALRFYSNHRPPLSISTRGFWSAEISTAMDIRMSWSLAPLTSTHPQECRSQRSSATVMGLWLIPYKRRRS